MSLSQWHTTAADNASAGTINWAEGQSPATVNDSARQTMADVRTWYEGMEWRDWGHTPVYSAATAFTISSSSSLTSIYAINRRIRTIDAIGTSYGTIVDTTWVSSTQTVHVENSVTLNNPMTSIAVGFDNANKPIHTDSISGLTANTITQPLLTTPGDMIYASSTATAARLAVGAATAVLIGGTTPSWTASPTLAAVVIGNASAGVVTGAVNSQNGFYVQGNKLSPGWNWLETLNPSATAVATFSTALLTGKTYLIKGTVTVTSTGQSALRFNADSGAHYAYEMEGGTFTVAGAWAAVTGGGSAATEAILTSASSANDYENFSAIFGTLRGNNNITQTSFKTTGLTSNAQTLFHLDGTAIWNNAAALSSVSVVTAGGVGTMTGKLVLYIFNES